MRHNEYQRTLCRISGDTRHPDAAGAAADEAARAVKGVNIMRTSRKRRRPFAGRLQRPPHVMVPRALLGVVICLVCVSIAPAATPAAGPPTPPSNDRREGALALAKLPA